MTRKVRCKLCGYVMDEARLKDVCPACGVSRKVFEPYDDPVEPERRRVIDMDLHPIVVHAPQALAFLLLLLVPVHRVLPQTWAAAVVQAVAVMAVLLPVTVVGGFVTGLIDGKARLRKVDTPLLRQKMAVGAVFFAVAAGAAWVAVVTEWTGGFWFATLNVLTVLGFACSTWLGIIGASLMPVVFIRVGSHRKAATPPAPGPSAGAPPSVP